MENNMTHDGGVLMNILSATSILKLAQQVAENRKQLSDSFDKRISQHPEDDSLKIQKESCLKKFDEANMDTMKNVEAAREVFIRYPEFSGLLL